MLLSYLSSQNRIPVFCPGLTDGSLGDMLYFHSFKKGDPDNPDLNPGLVIDIVGGMSILSSDSFLSSRICLMKELT